MCTSAGTGASTLSMSQMPWWIDWKCQRYSPVFMSIATIELENRFWPPRSDPSCEELLPRALPNVQYTSPSSGSIAGCIHGVAPPVCHELPSQVSLPSSPGPGAPQKNHTTSPLLASSARAAHRLLSCVPQYSTPSWCVTATFSMLPKPVICLSQTTAPVAWSSAMIQLPLPWVNTRPSPTATPRRGRPPRVWTYFHFVTPVLPSTAKTLPNADSM